MSAHVRRRPQRAVLAGLVLLTVLAGILSAQREPAGAVEPGVEVVYVARGLEFPDALAGSVIAALDNAPVILVPGGGDDRVPDAVRDELTRLEPGRIVVLGGSVAISDTVVAELAAYTDGAVTRLAGGDRYETAVEIAKALPGKAADADTLDGLDSTDFLGAGDTAADSELLDGMDSTDFLGVTERAADSELLDGRDSTDFLGADEQATDADTLDGLDSTAFVQGSAGDFVASGAYQRFFHELGDGEEVTVATAGPLSYLARCTINDGGTDRVEVIATSSADGWVESEADTLLTAGDEAVHNDASAPTGAIRLNQQQSNPKHVLTSDGDWLSLLVVGSGLNVFTNQTCTVFGAIAASA